MNHDEILELQEKFDARYKKREDCDSDMEEVNHKLANDDKRLAVIELQVKINNWLTAAIASGIIALVVRSFFGG